jgi:hypothetical protein
MNVWSSYLLISSNRARASADVPELVDVAGRDVARFAGASPYGNAVDVRWETNPSGWCLIAAEVNHPWPFFF